MRAPIPILYFPACSVADKKRRSATVRLQRFRSRTSPAALLFFFCHCALMLTAVAIWYVYAIDVVQDNAFSSRCACRD